MNINHFDPFMADLRMWSVHKIFYTVQTKAEIGACCVTYGNVYAYMYLCMEDINFLKNIHDLFKIKQFPCVIRLLRILL